MCSLKTTHIGIWQVLCSSLTQQNVPSRYCYWDMAKVPMDWQWIPGALDTFRGHSPTSRGCKNWLLHEWWIWDLTKIQPNMCQVSSDSHAPPKFVKPPKLDHKASNPNWVMCMLHFQSRVREQARLRPEALLQGTHSPASWWMSPTDCAGNGRRQASMEGWVYVYLPAGFTNIE